MDNKDPLGAAITQLRPPTPERNAQGIAGCLAAGILSGTSPKHQYQDLSHLHLHWWDILLINIAVGKRIILIDCNKIFIINTIHIDDGWIVLRLSSISYIMCMKESVVQRGS